MIRYKDEDGKWAWKDGEESNPKPEPKAEEPKPEEPKPEEKPQPKKKA